MDGRKMIAGQLRNAVENVHSDIARIESLANAEACFDAPIPEYDINARRGLSVE